MPLRYSPILLLGGPALLVTPLLQAAEPVIPSPGERSSSRTPGLYTCDDSQPLTQTATLEQEGSPVPLRPIPPPPLRSIAPSARQIVMSAESGDENLIDTRRPYGWTYTLIKEPGDDGAYSLASDSSADICSPALSEARALQFNMGHTLTILWDVFGLSGWNDAEGALVGIIEEDKSGGAFFHKEGPILSFPSREDGAVSYGRDLSIVAHEIAHGIEFFAGGPGSIRGATESLEVAAMIESFADIVGVGVAQIEASGYQGQAQGDWLFGQDIDERPFLRDLQNPGIHGGVDKLDGLLCAGGGIETYHNSGITSLAFVRMVDGDELRGIAPLGADHQTSLAQTLKLWMDVFTEDLSPESDFEDLETALLARTASDPAAHQTVELALASVGLCATSGDPCTPDTIDDTTLFPSSPIGQGRAAEEWLGAFVTSAALVDGDAHPDWLTSYSPEGSSNTYPLFVSEVDYLSDFRSPPSLEAPFNSPLCRGIPQPMALGDLNNDGQSEILLITQESDDDTCDLTILEGGASTGWSRPLIQSEGIDVRGVASGGDFNGDGIEDLLLLVEGNIAILRGWGDGDLPGLDSDEDLFIFQGDDTKHPSWMAPLVDINGDGISDILLSKGAEPSPLIVSAGPMRFDPAPSLPPSTRGFSLGYLGGEGDSYGDFALTNTQASLPGAPSGQGEKAGEIFLYLGGEGSSYRDARAHIAGDYAGAHLGRFVSGHDLNNDGIKEIYITDSGVVPGHKEGRVLRFEWTGDTLISTGELRGSGSGALMGIGLSAIEGDTPGLLVTAPGHRPVHPEQTCRVLDGGGVFSVTYGDFLPRP